MDPLTVDLLENSGYNKQIWFAALVVVATLAGVLGGARWHRSRGSGVTRGGMVTGRDNRRSTSKTIALAWTLVVGWMVVTEAFIAGLGLAYPKGVPPAAGDPVTLSGQLASASLLYLVFLGGPYAAAAFAKASTQTKVAAGQLSKPPAAAPSAFDLVADDDGNTDLVDLQYVLFNLLAVIIVVATFVAHAGAGLPEVPEFLAILTGGSALTYSVNKAVSTDTPRITEITPRTVRSHQSVRITGAQLTSRTAGGALPTVTIGGLPTTRPNSPIPDELNGTVPSAPADTQPLQGPVDVVVSLPNAVPIVVADTLAIQQEVVGPAGQAMVKDSVITVTGYLLLAPETANGTTAAGTATVGGLSVTLTAVRTNDPWQVAFEGGYSGATVTLKMSADPSPGLQDQEDLRL